MSKVNVPYSMLKVAPPTDGMHSEESFARQCATETNSSSENTKKAIKIIQPVLDEYEKDAGMFF